MALFSRAIGPLGLAAALLLSAAPGTAEDARRLRLFADELFASGEYFRAATEYMRLVSYGDLAEHERESIRFEIARCSFKAGRFAEAASLALRLAREASSTILEADCGLLAAASRYREERPDLALGLAEESLGRDLSRPYRDRFEYIRGLSLLDLDRPARAREAFSSVAAEGPLGPSAIRLASLAERAESRPRPSPLMTAGMSVLVPGLGQIACGYFWDGIAALALTGGSLALAVAGDRRGDDTLRAAGYTLFGVWHAGNILGGANAARRMQRQAISETAREARSLSALSLD